jgi:hypothetical protein
MSKNIWMAAIALIAIVSCVPTGIKTIENEGVLCFNEYENSSTVEGNFSPRGCFSSSCYELVEKSLNIQVDEGKNQIRFHTKVSINDFSKRNGICTTDCGGAGQIPFILTNVPRGNYTIWLGENQIGEFSNTLKKVSKPTTCLGQAY